MGLQILLLLVLLLAPMAYGINEVQPVAPPPPPTAADIVRAATAKAVAGLYEQVASMPLSRSMTVGQYLEHMEAKDEFMTELQRAEQLGGPRWIDPHTCQVQLQISTARIGHALKRIAGARPRLSPITAVEIDRAIRDWPRQRFTATGSSTSPAALKEIRPRPDQRWARVDDAEREEALQAARDQAVRRAMESVRSVRLGDRQTLGDAFGDPDVGRRIAQWLASRPVTRVDFRDDMQVEVALAVDDREFFEEVRAALSEKPAPALPRTEQQWNQVRREFLGKYQPAVGRVALRERGHPVRRQEAVRVSIRVPEWVTQQIDVQGSAPIIDSKLRAAMRAEIDGRNKLRERMEALPLDQNLTVGEVARKDPRMADALDRTVRRARVFRTEYRADGTAVVRLMADMRQFWDELNR